MKPKSSTMNQTALENWFTKKKPSATVADKPEARPITDDEAEGRSLPPPSEPDSGLEDGSEDEGEKKTSGKGKQIESDAEIEMEDSDDEQRSLKPSNEALPKRKLILVPEVVKFTDVQKARHFESAPKASGSKATKTKASKSTKGEKSTGTIKKTRQPKTEKAVAKKPRASKSKKSKAKGDDDENEESDEESDEDDKKAHPDDLKLPPLSKMPAIFKDIVSRNADLKRVADLFKNHNDIHGTKRKLRVGTMCSGTESPLLALQLISEAMELDPAMEGQKLEVEHIFSCEIEPFKQAYIERNFRPPILFRDVTELGGEEATTAYGSLVSIPGHIDLLVAGTSCVDYSNLNVHQKAITEGGESGNTFFGMLSYVKNHRPPIVILENVCSAPWNNVCEEFEQIGYRARHLRLDTKQFYIPHTRMRGYMIAIEARRYRSAGDDSIDNIADEWVHGMKNQMPRQASSTLEAFLLPSDDSRIHEGRQRLAMETKMSAGRRRKEIDWGRCEQRHSFARTSEHLGNKRPLTKWEEGGGYTFMDYIWADWCADAVTRVKDLMDISYLRSAKLGVDASYKTSVWNLSQNVDRQSGNRLGIAPCLTPSMIFYINNRGGPLVGLEALGLQGLPVDRLLLTRETQDQLADLAGNAMSTTVVGSAMILALMLSVDVLKNALENPKDRDWNGGMEAEEEPINVRSPYTDTLDDRIVGIEQLEYRKLELSTTHDLSWDELLRKANGARKWCTCEGRLSISDRLMRVCQDCGHTSCVRCGMRPEHEYIPVTFDPPRLQPIEFADDAKKALPMALTFSTTDEAEFTELHSQFAGVIDETKWKAWKDVVEQARANQLSFVDLRRQDIWVAVYESPTARLELHLHLQQPEWRLFAIPATSLPANSFIRTMLSTPIARMVCRGSILEGEWEYAIPANLSAELAIAGVGDGDDAFTDSWEKSLGLQEERFKFKQVWKTLKISFKNPDAIDLPNFDNGLTGIYEYLPKCGTACSSLHKKVKGLDGGEVPHDSPDIFFFLDPTRCREPSWDRFVFSNSIRRYEYDESRPIVARIDPKWRQSDTKETSATVSIDWQWVRAEALKCGPTVLENSLCAVPKGSLNLVVDNDTCARANALLTCSVPLGESPAALWPRDKWFEVDKLREREYFQLTSWILQRVRNIAHDSEWKSVVFNPTDDLGNYACERCAPTPPRIMWYKKVKGKGSDIKAIEDSRQAASFERALKARPPPFQFHVKYSQADQMGHIVLGINPATLVHQAASHLTKRTGVIEASWRLDTSYVPIPVLPTPSFIIPSNRHDEEASQPGGFKLKLRPEQLRSLKWMQSQEDTEKPFVEEEVCEGISEHLGWRLEGRVRRPLMVRGGVLADQVGYGKTALMLGLICTRNAKQIADPVNCPPGKILAKGTCVIVPAHLVLQWKGEVDKFIAKIHGKTPKVVTLHQGTEINSTTIEDIQKADIVLVASTMPNSDHYLANLGAFAGVSLPTKAGRYFNARLTEAQEALKKQVALLQQPGGVEKVQEAIQLAHENIDKQEHFVQPKRLKGRAYAEANADVSKKLQGTEATNGEAKSKPSIPARSNTNPSLATKSSSTETTFKRSTRLFEGVYVRPLSDFGLPRVAKFSVANPRRRTAGRKSVINVDSDDSSVENSKASSESQSDDYSDGLSSTGSTLEEELESSSENGTESTDAESDVPQTKKTKAPVVKKPAAKPQPAAASGRKRKAADSGVEEGDDKRPAKKVRTTAPKKTRVEKDPWKLSDPDVQKDWTQMQAPPLDMFHFHRVVVDEFTYTKKEHVSHAVVTRLSATCRWVLSGTPPIGDFASVKGIAAFLGIHLGIDDDAEGTTEEVKARTQDKTAAETFHSFREVRSAHWHITRQRIAQDFLNQFVRQNIAEIEDIPSVEKIRAVTMTASERALYLELDHYLRAQELKMKKTGKSQSDRVRRLNRALGESKTPEEALLKAASHFDCQSDKLNSTMACDTIVDERKAERDKCIRELRRKLIRAFKMERKLARSRQSKDENNGTHFDKVLKEWKHGGDKDDETKNILADLVAEAKDPDAVPDPESESEQEAVISKNKSVKGKQMISKNPAKRVQQGDELEGVELEWAHREHAHELRALAKELGGRVRSLRFFQCVRAFQGDENYRTDCPACKRTGLLPHEVSILSSCGHTGCHACVAAAASNEACVQQASGGCRVPASPLFVIPANSLGHDRPADSDGRHWGQKLEDIVSLIRSLPKNERVLIFVQFPDLTKKVAESLATHKLRYAEIRGTPLQQSKTLQEFQDPNSNSKILLLNLGDESASGGNLTVANHAIFVSPLLAKNQFEYRQAETQAIGRIRRFGQIKTANIYRFVTRTTIDEEIYKKQEQDLGDLSVKSQEKWLSKGGDKTTSTNEVDRDDNEMDVDS